MIAGETKWTDYVLEGRVLLKAETGNAGLIFRVNDAGPGHDQMRGYYVGLDTDKLYLGKMENNWQPLAEFDLGKLDCRVLPDVWNQIRVAVQGPRIRVWLNRMHPSADPDRGLRIDFTDANEPILSGAIGVRTHLVPAWFDNIVVLPITDLPCATDVVAQTAQPVTYRGWKAHVLENDLVQLHVVPDIGGRVIQYTLGKPGSLRKETIRMDPAPSSGITVWGESTPTTNGSTCRTTPPKTRTCSRANCLARSLGSGRVKAIRGRMTGTPAASAAIFRSWIAP